FFPTTAPGRATPVRSSSRHHVGVSCFTTDTSVFRVEPGSSKRKTIRRLTWGLGSKKVRMMFSGGYKWPDLIKQDPREPVRNHAEGHSPRSCNHRPKALCPLFSPRVHQERGQGRCSRRSPSRAPLHHPPHPQNRDRR